MGNPTKWEKWREINPATERQALLDQYRDDAVVYDEKERKVYQLDEELPERADENNPRYIDYPYTAVMRTMPVLSNNQMKKQRITTLIFRFLKSWLPKVTSIAAGRPVKTDVITNLKTGDEGYSGVWSIPFPGTWDEDVQTELTSDEPAPVKILALNAEVQ